MPRVCCSTNDPIDFCTAHFPSEKAAREQYGDLGDGPDGRGNCFEYDACHPDYGGERYRCAQCGAELTDFDNLAL